MQKIIEYWKTEEGYESITDDNAFCAYEYANGEFFIAHFYVHDRTGGKSRTFFNRVKEAAIGLGATRITGVLHRNEANADQFHKKLLIHLRNGYKILSIAENRITVIYELD